MAVTKSRHDPWQLFGLSTDVKWTDSEMPVGSKFHATDTDADYVWSGTAWETIAAGTVAVSSGTFTLQGATTPVIYNVSITAGDTNYSQAITSNATRFGLSTQTGASTATIRIAFATSAATSGGTAIQMTADSEYYEDDLTLTGDLTVYFTASTAPQTVQIIAWS